MCGLGKVGRDGVESLTLIVFNVSLAGGSRGRCILPKSSN